MEEPKNQQRNFENSALYDLLIPKMEFYQLIRFKTIKNRTYHLPNHGNFVDGKSL
jgi:hypothetical protein